ncbi:SLAP domain-containing protein [Lactobacillus sp. ESL0791]|uniref:SLAP domain-containing protein n=1 Tax=Lactobacillus sp. ESL0791 TaxID=2983234 RepID=UPI0023FA31DC|nr:SLAP domain-containing protein [Lactobacillus sp. ESL0791]MDF7638442.1 SLAP domain-containing protein [Lactobacillus sp. ESL0791]
MKKNKKLITMLSAAMIMTAPAAIVANSNQTYAAQSTDQRTNEKQGTLTLNHSTRVYNKNGQKLRSYNGGSSLLKKGAAIAYSGKVQSITDPSSKRYSYHDDEWNWFYLPYNTIKGQEYYSIGHGGYVKAVNVNSINGNFLYVDNAAGVTKEFGKQKISLYDSHGKKLDKYLGSNQKIIIDRIATADSFDSMIDNLNGTATFYRIKDTNEFVNTYAIKTNLRQKLQVFSDYTQVYFVNDAKAYTKLGKTTNTTFKKGDICSISNVATSMSDPDDNKTETFYRISDSTNLFIKANDVKYISGPKLNSLN